MRWSYGEKIFSEFPELRQRWSDDLEIGLKVADRYFDYLWSVEESGAIVLTDRLFSDGITDKLTKEREESETLVLSFTDANELFSYLLPRMKAIVASTDPDFVAAIAYMENRSQRRKTLTEQFESASARAARYSSVKREKEPEPVI